MVSLRRISGALQFGICLCRWDGCDGTGFDVRILIRIERLSVSGTLVKRIIVIPLLIGALSAVASPKPDLGQPNYEFSEKSGKGLAVVSMTMPWFRHGHPKNARFFLHYYGTTKPRAVKSLVLEHENYFTGRNIKSDFGGEIFGVVFAVELTAGEYLLAGWGLDGNTTPLHISPSDLQPIPFTVMPGRAVYLGNLDMTIEMGLNLIGIEGLRDASVGLRDEYVRDSEIFLKKYPKVLPDQVRNAAIIDATWQYGPTYKQRKLSPIVDSYYLPDK